MGQQSRIFISYRRSDSEAIAGRLYDRLCSHFGDDAVFMDVDAIGPGEDFVAAIEHAVASCDALVAVVGPGWLDARDSDSRRIDSPEDFVRVEIAAALERDVLVVPVLVGGATMPRSSDLPEPLRTFARRNALSLDHTRWRHDTSRLVEVLERRLAARSAPNRPAAPDPDVETARSERPALEPPPGAASPPVTITPPLVSRPVNLGFDGGVEKGFPHGWFDGEFFVSNVSTSYRPRVLPRAEAHGACLVYENPQAASDEFGVVMQRCPAQFLAGKAIRLEAELATTGVERWAGLWLRADGKGAPNIFFDNMERNPVRGTTAWARYTLDGQLPQEIVWLNYGIVIAGPGSLWADSFRLLVWSGGRWEDV